MRGFGCSTEDRQSPPPPPLLLCPTTIVSRSSVGAFSCRFNKRGNGRRRRRRQRRRRWWQRWMPSIWSAARNGTRPVGMLYVSREEVDAEEEAIVAWKDSFLRSLLRSFVHCECAMNGTRANVLGCRQVKRCSGKLSTIRIRRINWRNPQTTSLCARLVGL